MDEGRSASTDRVQTESTDRIRNEAQCAAEQCMHSVLGWILPAVVGSLLTFWKQCGL